MEMNIVRATAKDAADISYFHALSWQSAYAGIVPQEFLSEFTPEKQAERARLVMPTRPEEYYISYLGGKPMGMFILGESLDADVAPGTGEIFALYLLPDYWGQGYGKRLMDYAMNRLRELSFTDIVLWVLEDNQRARAFYEKSGYRFDGAKKEIMIGKPLTEVRYILYKE